MISYHSRQECHIDLPTGLGTKAGANLQYTWLQFVQGVNQQASNGESIIGAGTIDWTVGAFSDTGQTHISSGSYLATASVPQLDVVIDNLTTDGLGGLATKEFVLSVMPELTGNYPLRVIWDLTLDVGVAANLDLRFRILDNTFTEIVTSPAPGLGVTIWDYTIPPLAAGWFIAGISGGGYTEIENSVVRILTGTITLGPQ